MTRPTSAVDLDGLTLPTPVMVASGCFGPEMGRFAPLRKLGGIVTRSITVNRTTGAPTPRLVETPSGLLTETGLQNNGIDCFMRDELPALTGVAVPVFVSVAGSAVEDFMQLTMALDVASHSIAAIEVNTCCPSRDRDGQWFAARPSAAAEVVGAVARLTRLPVFAKLPAGVGDVVEVAEACVQAGAHGLTLIHSVPAMAMDPATLRPSLGGRIGGLSGPAIRPIAVRAVHDAARALPDVPILGVGGVTGWRDAVEMLAAGAWAVQMGTAILSDPGAPVETAAGVLRFLRDRGMTSVADLRRRSVSVPPAAVGAVGPESP